MYIAISILSLLFLYICVVRLWMQEEVLSCIEERVLSTHSKSFSPPFAVAGNIGPVHAQAALNHVNYTFPAFLQFIREVSRTSTHSCSSGAILTLASLEPKGGSRRGKAGMNKQCSALLLAIIGSCECKAGQLRPKQQPTTPPPHELCPSVYPLVETL